MFPPNYDKIRRAFPTQGRPGILYAYGDIIYNPSGVNIPPWVEVHEAVHGERQQQGVACAGLCLCNGGITEWWDRYIADKDFRLVEEILAHNAEWKAYSGPYRDNYLGHMAERLSGDLYGNLISYEDAVKEITKP